MEQTLSTAEYQNFLSLCNQAHSQNTVPELKKIAERLGLPKSGTKIELCERIAWQLCKQEKGYNFQQDRETDLETLLHTELGQLPDWSEYFTREFSEPNVRFRKVMRDVGYDKRVADAARTPQAAVQLMFDAPLGEIIAALPQSMKKAAAAQLGVHLSVLEPLLKKEETVSTADIETLLQTPLNQLPDWIAYFHTEFSQPNVGYRQILRNIGYNPGVAASMRTPKDAVDWISGPTQKVALGYIIEALPEPMKQAAADKLGVSLNTLQPLLQMYK